MEDRIRRTHELIGPALRAQVDAMHPDLARAVGYHLGWWDEHGTPSRAYGKASRATICLAACTALGGRQSDAVPAAAALEMVHQQSLIHDDIIDDDTLRRGRPSAWTAFGTPVAILAGDSMAGAAFALLAAKDGHAADVLRSAYLRVCDGQAADLALEGDLTATPEAYVEMALGKAGALFGASTAIGAVMAGADQDTVERMRQAGIDMGVAMQVVDDIRSIWQPSSGTGKTTKGDLVRGKLTYPVIAALRSPDSDELAALLRDPQECDTVKAAALVEDLGGRADAEEFAAQRLRLALGGLAAVPMSDEGREDLLRVFTWASATHLLTQF
ncbi:geranylgeranyl diphosphate synthase type I [Herbihabitans rhizosphaerae]|uniref:Geranylgeranyl diphosphate synthase type I n=1 Tax=Herbihabitans rhizosphaerae TaxID=1872711 RepID=A0A4Q7KFV8_9PSEU|nr:polyprenyl synthetase family protein [Herbihabitans rhizosphaerae]RZS33949.1 geranylgeranyl diphosphate synthase type I [Herbihabitans rhizosphaerae]